MSELVTATTSSFSARWNDKGSGATRDGGFWHPNSQGNMRPLGSVGVPHYKDINGNYVAQLIGPGSYSQSNGLPPLVSPTGYTQIWNDQKSGASKDGAFWRPIPPNGYVALGDVSMAGWSQTPSTSDVWCVRQDLVKQGSFAASSVWDDKKSGAKYDVSIWEVRSASRTNSDTEIETAAVYTGAIRASQTYNAPDSVFAKVPLV
ncbi:hypothetical protein CFAM422_002510 [Trichoderma lentiforme]|uniref:DUF946 domain-containing protein n=1 Tax=Trichoderma lentiforme TaxID=1567552 RepID=A0A9P4XKJ1_9HYPO|nr:hypothetical protein CFAM422_002510 [Trichoderma lentiforme]